MKLYEWRFVYKNRMCLDISTHLSNLPLWVENGQGIFGAFRFSIFLWALDGKCGAQKGVFHSICFMIIFQISEAVKIVCWTTSLTVSFFSSTFQSQNSSLQISNCPLLNVLGVIRLNECIIFFHLLFSVSDLQMLTEHYAGIIYAIVLIAMVCALKCQNQNTFCQTHNFMQQFTFIIAFCTFIIILAYKK